jgi:ankyrin repeat protein
MQAAENGHLEVVKYLVQAGADMDKENKVIMSSLRKYLVYSYRPTCVRLNLVGLLTFASCCW